MDQSSRRNGQKTKAELAKGATERQEIDVFIDISLSYLKHRIRAKYGNQWNQTWKNSTNGERTRANFPNVEVRTEVNLTLEFFLTQFLTGHGKFNEYLSQMKIGGNNKRKCGSVQSPNHIFRCHLMTDLTIHYYFKWHDHGDYGRKYL